MKQGTSSVLFGCHSIIHSLLVLIAWKKLYKRYPARWQIICILIHDIGHWGKNYLNNYEEKKEHWVLGAKLADRLFGAKGFYLVMGHCSYNGQARSELYEPDKYSWQIAPIWWMISSCIFEPKLQRKGCTKYQSALMFKKAMKENMESGYKKQGHDIYLEQWGHYSSKV